MEGAQVGCDVTADVQMFAGLERQTVKCWLRAGEGGPGEGGRRQAGVSARDIQRKRTWYRKMDILDGGGGGMVVSADQEEWCRGEGEAGCWYRDGGGSWTASAEGLDPRDACGRLVREGSSPLPQSGLDSEELYRGCMSDMYCEGKRVCRTLQGKMRQLARLIKGKRGEADGVNMIMKMCGQQKCLYH
jgi:hypothetical protein